MFDVAHSDPRIAHAAPHGPSSPGLHLAPRRRGQRGRTSGLRRRAPSRGIGHLAAVARRRARPHGAIAGLHQRLSVHELESVLDRDREQCLDVVRGELVIVVERRDPRPKTSDVQGVVHGVDTCDLPAPLRILRIRRPRQVHEAVRPLLTEPTASTVSGVAPSPTTRISMFWTLARAPT